MGISPKQQVERQAPALPIKICPKVATSSKRFYRTVRRAASILESPSQSLSPPGTQEGPATVTAKSLFAMLPSIVPRIQQKVMEQQIVANSPKLMALLNHPAGPFTVHFWAPTIKWAISIANVADMRRSAEHVSVAQQTAVTATGLIWSRYSMVITPKNWNLFAVNVFMAGTGLVQFYRKFTYDHSDKVQAIASSNAKAATL